MLPQEDELQLKKHPNPTMTPIEGADAAANPVGEAAVHTWNEAARRLAPIVGEEGFRALLKRNLHITAPAFPWLEAPQLGPPDAPFEEIKRALGGETPERAQEASLAIYTTFIDLLTGLIGKALTTRLFAQVPAPGKRNEPKQEMKK